MSLRHGQVKRGTLTKDLEDSTLTMACLCLLTKPDAAGRHQTLDVTLRAYGP